MSHGLEASSAQARREIKEQELLAEVNRTRRQYLAARAAEEGYVHPVSQLSAGPEPGKSRRVPSAWKAEAIANYKRALDRFNDFLVNGYGV